MLSDEWVEWGERVIRTLYLTLCSRGWQIKRENVSMNQFITLALAEKISALMTEEYLAERAGRGSRDKFERAMRNVADVELAERDWM